MLGIMPTSCEPRGQVFLRGLSAAASGERGTGISYPGSPERLLGRVAAGPEQALGDPRGNVD